MSTSDSEKRVQALLRDSLGGQRPEMNDSYVTLEKAWKAGDIDALTTSLQKLHEAIEAQGSRIDTAFYDSAIDNILLECISAEGANGLRALAILSNLLSIMILDNEYTEKCLAQMNLWLRKRDTDKAELVFRCMHAIAQRGGSHRDIVHPHVMYSLIIAAVVDCSIPVEAREAAIDLLCVFDKFDMVDEDLRHSIVVVHRDDIVSPVYRTRFVAWLVVVVPGALEALNVAVIQSLVQSEISRVGEPTSHECALRCLLVLAEKAGFSNINFADVLNLVDRALPVVSVNALLIARQWAIQGHVEQLLESGIAPTIREVLVSGFSFTTRVAALQCFEEVIARVPRGFIETIVADSDFSRTLVQALEIEDIRTGKPLFGILTTILGQNDDTISSNLMSVIQECEGWPLITSLMSSDNCHLGNLAVEFYHAYETEETGRMIDELDMFD